MGSLMCCTKIANGPSDRNMFIPFSACGFSLFSFLNMVNQCFSMQYKVKTLMVCFIFVVSLCIYMSCNYACVCNLCFVLMSNYCFDYKINVVILFV